MRTLALCALAFVLTACSSDDGDDASGTPDAGVSGDASEGAPDATRADAIESEDAPDVEEPAYGENEPFDPADFGADPFPDGRIGGDRPARIVFPSDYAPDQRWPVVTLLHGFTASSLVQDAYFGVSGLADELGIVVLLPDGTTNSQGAQFWNATDWCCDFERTGVDDAGYLIGLIDEVRDQVPVDASRIVFIGHSNGGFMSYHLACNHSDVVTGVVSLAGLEWLDETQCEPDNPVTVLQIHGTADGTVAYDNDPLLPSAPLTVERWVERNDCDAEAMQSGTYDFEPSLDGEETLTETWSDCGRGTGVALWEIPEGSHVPGLTTNAIRDSLLFALDRPRQAP